jgi:hypothetical protein
LESRIVTFVSTNLVIRGGTCHVLYAYDIGMAIDLKACQGRLASLGRVTLSGRNRRAPKFFDYDPPPLTIIHETAPRRLGTHEVSSSVDLTFYDFGALSIDYAIPFAGGLETLRALSATIAENEDLLHDARRRAAELQRVLGRAVDQPQLAALVEDYAIFEVTDFALPCAAAELPQHAGPVLAQALRGEAGELSEQETADALACRVSYGRDDLTLIDWNAAILFDRDAEDVRAVLEFANVELLELRCLDRLLDGSLDRSYELALRQSRLWRFVPGRVARHLRRISRMQLDGAILFERVSNAPKLLGDQFLARVYRLAAQRFHLNEWSTGVLRKLDTIEDFYRQLSDSASGVRLEMLDWIIILLIVIEIVMPLIPGLLPRP